MGALCAIVFYKKLIRGKLYPKAARTGPYAFAQEVSRVDGRVVTRYLGIMQVVPERDVIEMEEGSHGHQPGQPEQVQQTL